MLHRCYTYREPPLADNCLGMEASQLIQVLGQILASTILSKT